MSAAFGDFFRGRRVLVTGHTGFKGSWLCEWLLLLGARVIGLSQPPPTNPALFDQLGLASRLDHRITDVRDGEAVRRVLAEARPDVVIHMAAQPLVRLSYEQPVETYETNVLGTVNVLQALRSLDQPCAAVMVTTDKCYENREWTHAYREADALGGHDPYSSSKACAEIATDSFRRSFFPPTRPGPVRIASARAGNVIGGGDWAADRIVPDCVRALQAGQPVPVRNKTSTRPWQHVLEPLSGYLLLAMRIHPEVAGTDTSVNSAFNFGPTLESNRTVLDLVQELFKTLPGSWTDASDPTAPHEAGRLNLATDKAFHLLGWTPSWNFRETVRRTAQWYQDARHLDNPAAFQKLTCDQIMDFMAASRR